MTVTKQAEESIQRTGYGISGEIGGIGRQTYYTPDGQRVRAIPAIRDYVIKKDGKVIESGTRDANYDKGWLPVMPKELKPHCDGCDNWHDTEEEIETCITNRQVYAKKWETRAKKETEGEAMAQGKEMEDMRVEIQELKGMLYEVLHKRLKSD